MNTPLEQEPTRQSISLARLATILAVGFAIAFGLCTAGVIRNVNNPGILVYFALVIEAICAIGLLVVAVLAIIRSVRRKQ
jgi:cation transporter-like permease